MSEEIDVALTVSTPDEPLELEDPGSYGVEAFGPGGQAWRRRSVENDYQHGVKVIAERLESGNVTGVIRVYGSTWAEVRVNVTAMFEALSQHVYTITAVIDGVTDIYVCGPADISPVSGDTWSKYHLFAKMQEFQFSAPYNPQEVITS
jgi:hypothetical protein